MCIMPCVIPFLKKKIYLFLDREGKGGRKRRRDTSMLKRYIDQMPLACPQVGTWPTTQASALTGNWTNDLSVHTSVLNPLSHISQACYLWYRTFVSSFSLAGLARILSILLIFPKSYFFFFLFFLPYFYSSRFLRCKHR